MLKQGFAVAVLIALALPPDAASAASIGRCGGNGGGQTASLSCPGGQYVVALSAKGGKYLDRLGIKCAAFNSAGARGAIGHSAGAGGSGGSESASTTCPGNRAIVAMIARGDAWMDSMGNARCALRKAGGGFAAPTTEDSTLLELNVGGYGGNQCHLRCPAGQAVHQVKVRYGSWIDSIEVFCRP